MMLVLDQFVNTTRLGRGIRAVAQDTETAVLMGVNIDRVDHADVPARRHHGRRARPRSTSCFFELTAYNVGFLLGIKAFTAAVLGGIGNIRGALIGGLLLGLIENYGAGIFGTQWQDVVAFSVLVLVLMFRPTGILGEQLGGRGHEQQHRPACAAEVRGRRRSGSVGAWWAARAGSGDGRSTCC